MEHQKGSIPLLGSTIVLSTSSTASPTQVTRRKSSIFGGSGASEVVSPNQGYSFVIKTAAGVRYDLEASSDLERTVWEGRILAVMRGEPMPSEPLYYDSILSTELESSGAASTVSVMESDPKKAQLEIAYNGGTMVLASGWLTKRGKVNTEFKPRFFVLSASQSTGLILSYFQSPWTMGDSQKPKGTIPLEGSVLYASAYGEETGRRRSSSTMGAFGMRSSAVKGSNDQSNLGDPKYFFTIKTADGTLFYLRAASAAAAKAWEGMILGSIRCDEENIEKPDVAVGLQDGSWMKIDYMRQTEVVEEASVPELGFGFGAAISSSDGNIRGTCELCGLAVKKTDDRVREEESGAYLHRLCHENFCRLHEEQYHHQEIEEHQPISGKDELPFSADEMKEFIRLGLKVEDIKIALSLSGNVAEVAADMLFQAVEAEAEQPRAVSEVAEAASSEIQEARVYKVVFEELKLGVSIVPGPSGCPIVASSPTALPEKGHEIIAVNGAALGSSPFASCLDMIKQSGRPLTLSFKECVEEAVYDVVFRELKLGIGIASGLSGNVVVTSSPTAYPKEGHEIVAVNGALLGSCSFTSCLDMIKQSGRPLTISFKAQPSSVRQAPTMDSTVAEDESSVKIICDLGFTATQAKGALEHNEGNLAEAIDYILTQAQDQSSLNDVRSSAPIASPPLLPEPAGSDDESDAVDADLVDEQITDEVTDQHFESSAPVIQPTAQVSAAAEELPSEATVGSPSPPAALLGPGQMALIFEMAKPFGLDLGVDTLEVKSCESGSQAEDMGVGRSWRVVFVNGESVKGGVDFQARLDDVRSSGMKAVEVVFDLNSTLKVEQNARAVTKDASTFRDSVYVAPGGASGKKIVMEGYLLKKGDNLLTPFQSRWFVASGHYLK